MRPDGFSMFSGMGRHHPGTPATILFFPPVGNTDLLVCATGGHR